MHRVGRASRDDSRNFDSLQSLNSLLSSNELLQQRNEIGGNESLGRRAAWANNHPSPVFFAVSFGLLLLLLVGLLILQKQAYSCSKGVRQQIPC